MNYNEAIEFLLALPDMERSNHPDRAKTMSLDSMHELLSLLDNPQAGRKTAHVTGSKGKGSASAFLSSMLAAKQSVSTYSSPHLHSYRERICLNLQAVPEADFALSVSEIKNSLSRYDFSLGPISTFGAMTAAFFHLSRRKETQWQVVEVGMGGKTDATNVIDKKELVLMTAVSLEHTKILGKTTVEIAQNKAGLIRPGAKVVLASQKDAEIKALIQNICRDKAADFIDVSALYKVEPLAHDSCKQSFRIKHGAIVREFELSMLGAHQLDNAAAAIAAIDALAEMNKPDIPNEEECREALKRVFVPGRLELLSSQPLVLVDGAHNGESVAALVHSLERHFGAGSCVFVLGLNSDKNLQDIIEALAPVCKSLIASSSKSEKAMDPELIFRAAKLRGLDAHLLADSKDALHMAGHLAGKDGVVCATGSLYLVAEIREEFGLTASNWSLLRAEDSSACQV